MLVKTYPNGEEVEVMPNPVGHIGISSLPIYHQADVGDWVNTDGNVWYSRTWVLDQIGNLVYSSVQQLAVDIGFPVLLGGLYSWSNCQSSGKETHGRVIKGRESTFLGDVDLTKKMQRSGHRFVYFPDQDVLGIRVTEDYGWGQSSTVYFGKLEPGELWPDFNSGSLKFYDCGAAGLKVYSVGRLDEVIHENGTTTLEAWKKCRLSFGDGGPYLA